MEFLTKVILMQEQLQIYALSKPVFIKLINSSSKLSFSVEKLWDLSKDLFTIKKVENDKIH